MKISRRHFIRNTSHLSLGLLGLQQFIHCKFKNVSIKDPGYGFGALVSDPDKIIDLPENFSYSIISRTGDKMSDGFLVPSVPDGMATFSGPDGETILIRNHEINPGSPAQMGAFGQSNKLLKQLNKDQLYDPGQPSTPCLGGTTTIIYDTVSGKLLKQFLSLAGTLRNCAGGPTPWNSWLSCEETVERAGEYCQKDHGYIFEVPASVTIELADPVPYKEMGRFNHEAVAVDPRSSIIYLSEDREDGLLYRFIPNNPGHLYEGGTLQALCIEDHAQMDTRNWNEQTVQERKTMKVSWINLENVDSDEDDLRYRGFEKNAARFARGEGMWYGQNEIYFTCTNGGRCQKGQIWHYFPSPDEGTEKESKNPGKLELFIEPNDANIFENVDNLTIAPWGDLIVCEDGPGEQFLVGVTPKGHVYTFARNTKSNSEFTGVTFSPDGSTLFVNIQHDGLTLAITGPWKT